MRSTRGARSALSLTLAAVVILIALPCAAGVIMPYGDWQWGASYQVSFPTGDTADFTKRTSWRGVGFEGNRQINMQQSVGVSVSWNVFHEKAYHTSTTARGTVSGTQLRDINSVPILVTTHYELRQGRQARPYLGIGLGTLYTHYRTDVGLFTSSQDAWAFAVAPEIGVRMPYDKFLGYVGLRWVYATDAGDLPKQSYTSIILGFGLR